MIDASGAAAEPMGSMTEGAARLPGGRERDYPSHMVDQPPSLGPPPGAGRGDRADGAALLGKACDVLEAVAACPGGISQAELAARLGLSRTTLYRILGALVARGLIRQDPARRVYALGFRLLEMAQGIGACTSAEPGGGAPDLTAAAVPELRALRDATGETAYIAVLEGREALSLGKYEGAHEVRSAARLGVRKPLHCTSQGKAILAFLPEAERAALVKRLPMTRLTPHTITDRRRLAASLRIVRARGFATDDEEIVEGVRCVGAPVLDADGRVLGAVSIAGPAWRMTRERLELLGPEMAAAGRRIGAQLRRLPTPSPAGAPASALALPGPAAFSGLGPRWSPSGLWWADALAPEIHHLAEGADRRVARWDAPLKALALAGDGDALVVDATGDAARITAAGEVRATRRGAPALAGLRALRVRPGGETWASIHLPEEGASLVGPLSADGAIRSVWRLPGEVSALAWAEEGAALFAAAPVTGAVHRLEPGRPAPLLMTRLPAGGGRPAGLAADAEGGLWVALRDGWSIARLGPDGEVDRVLPLPVPRPTDLGFGGPSLGTLYVTTARDGVPLETLNSAPLSGRLLAAAPGVRGVPEVETGWL